MNHTSTLHDQTINLTSLRPAKIGPNSIIQLRNAAINILGREKTQTLFRNAGYHEFYDAPLNEMIDEEIPNKVFSTLFLDHPDCADEIACRAGELTADYIIENRIPAPVVFLLKFLPPKLSGSLLMKAINKNAWTFSGSGNFSYENQTVPYFAIQNNPICMPNGIWHKAVFQRLFSTLVCTETRVKYMSLDKKNTDYFVICFGKNVFKEQCLKYRKNQLRRFCLYCSRID